MSDNQKFSLLQVFASAALESRGLTQELRDLLEKSIESNSTLEEILPLLIDG